MSVRSGSGLNQLTGYGSSRYKNLQFDGDATKFEKWEERFLEYMELKQLREIILPTTNDKIAQESITKVKDIVTSTEKAKKDDIKDTHGAKNRMAYGELIQFLDKKSLELVMRNAADDGRRALEILHTHYPGETSVVKLWIDFATIEKSPSETCTDYICRVEKIATSLRRAGESVSDSVIVAMTTKGLTESVFGPFVELMQINEDNDFKKFKRKLREFENLECCRNLLVDNDKIVKARVIYREHGECADLTRHTGKNGGRAMGIVSGLFWRFCRSPSQRILAFF